MIPEEDTTLTWFQKELSNKKIKIKSIDELANGYLFMEIIHKYHPKVVDLSKIYVKSKSKY